MGGMMQRVQALGGGAPGVGGGGGGGPSVTGIPGWRGGKVWWDKRQIRNVIETFERMGTKASKKAVGSGTNAALTVIASHFRKHIDASSIRSPNAASLKYGAKKTVGKRFLRGGTSRMGKTTERIAVAGFGVGKTGANRSKVQSKRTTLEETAKRKPKPSVGVSAQNIHWFVLGAKGVPQTPSFFKDVASRVEMSAMGPAKQRARAKMKQVMDREAEKALAKSK